MGRSTKEFLEKRLVNADEILWRALSSNPDTFLGVPGGRPLLVEGRSVGGGRGSSGGHYDDDDKVAAAAAERYEELVAESGAGIRGVIGALTGGTRGRPRDER